MRLLIIGFGSIGQRHYRNIKKNYPKIQIFVLRIKKNTPILNKNNKLISKRNVKINEINSIDDAKKIIPHVVLICNPTSLHIDYAIIFAKIKSHIFIEKPISNNFNKIKKLELLIKKNKLKLMVGYHLRFNDCLKYIKDILRKNIIGNLCFANIILGDRLPTFHEYEDYSFSYASIKNLGGGVVLSQSHAIDYAIYFFGMPLEVYSCGGKNSNLKINVEDTSLSILKFKNNGRVFPVSLSLDFIQWPSKRSFSLIGDKGSLNWNYEKNQVKTVFFKNKKTIIKKFNKKHRDDMYTKEISYFIDSINKNYNIYPDLKDGKNVLKICLAIKKSINQNKVIKL